MKDILISIFKVYIVPGLLSISSFSGIILFLLIGKKIDIPNIDISKTDFSCLNGNLIYFKYLIFFFLVLLLTYISISLAKNFLNSSETIEAKEIKPIEGTFLPVYIGLFVIALSFNEKNLTVETIFLMLILFLFWLKLESVSYFNPFLLFFGYRFYEIKSNKATTFTLITRRKDFKISDETKDEKTIKLKKDGVIINNYTVESKINTSPLSGLICINNFTFLEK